MSVAKIERDIKSLENELEEINTTISDPIERNEYRKELEKKLKRLQRTKAQTEQLEKEQQELESLKSEFISNSEESSEVKESKDDDNEKIKFETEELMSTTSSPSTNIATESKRSNIAILFSIVYGAIGLLLILFVADSFNNRFYITSYEENQDSELTDLESSSVANNLSEENTEDEYLSESTELESSSIQSNLSEESIEDRYSSNSSNSVKSDRFSSNYNSDTEQTRQSPLSKQDAVNLVNRYLQAKSEIFSPPFNRNLASEILTGKALHDVIKTDGSIDWLAQNNAYYRYGEMNVEPLSFFWSDDNEGEMNIRIYEEYYFYRNNRLAKSNKYSDKFNFKFSNDDGVWKISDKSIKSSKDRYSYNSTNYSFDTKQTRQSPLSKQDAVDLVNKYLQAKSEIFSHPFNRNLASEILTGKALHDVIKTNGSIDWLAQNNAYYRYGEMNVQPLSLFWSDNNEAEMNIRIYEEYYFYRNNRLAKSNKYSDKFNFKFSNDDGVWKISDKSTNK